MAPGLGAHLSLGVADQPPVPATATEAHTAATGRKACSGTTSHLPTDWHDTRARYMTAAITNELGVDLGYREDYHLLVLRGFQPRGESELVTSRENPESEGACRGARDPGRPMQRGGRRGPSGRRAGASARGHACACRARARTALRVCVCARGSACGTCVHMCEHVHMHVSTCGHACTRPCVCASVLGVRAEHACVYIFVYLCVRTFGFACI